MQVAEHRLELMTEKVLAFRLARARRVRNMHDALVHSATFSPSPRLPEAMRERIKRPRLKELESKA